ncbi:E3 ubiquitin-protein ligase RBBP6-like isoform X1 [Panicum miliaceum]|uniref:E3 ubiquitin-protein ligase RBBP6-like isoform X1 n=1 Tax=Panicum miliaceum TaxID=4540 RepID=A0A3L6SE16_PANMI|nr:E3 ubiquitin-protein ligase RBBP6-like isoform X1 [Panicum miliaceum]
MAVYYKFKSARDYDSIPIEGQFISVANLKERIFESKHLGRGTDFDLMISNAQTDEEYADEATMIPKNTSVLIRRIPGRPRKPIVTEPEESKVAEDVVEVVPAASGFLGDSSMKYPEESKWDDEFGNELYVSDSILSQPASQAVDASENKVDEDSKIKALIDTSALDYSQIPDGYGSGRGYGRGMGGRMMAGRGFGRGLERKTPPPGYVCHRCKVPGHFIQHCPTNGDARYDVRRMKPPTGIPKSMLMQTPDGSYALPSGAGAVLKPNEAAFEKEIEGLPTTRSVGDLPPELRCPLCKEVMKDAVLTSKCCFRSFCDKCIRDYIINKSVCVCGATNILADDLLPNKTLRETISRILEAPPTSSTENVGSMVQVQDMESALPVQPKVRSPAVSAASKEETKAPTPVEVSPDAESLNGAKATNIDVSSADKKATTIPDVAEGTMESKNVKEDKPLEVTPVAKDSQEKLPSGEQAVKKKKKKKACAPGNADEQWKIFQDFGAENFAGMPLGPAGAFNPYWGGGVPLPMDYMGAPFPGPMPYMGYPPAPFDPFGGGILPQDPFMPPGYMMPGVPRDLSELAVNPMGINMGPPIVRTEEFDPRKRDHRRREMDRFNERERERGRSREPRGRSMEREREREREHRERERERERSRERERDRELERERARDREPRRETRESSGAINDSTSMRRKDRSRSHSQPDRSERAPPPPPSSPDHRHSRRSPHRSSSSGKKRSSSDRYDDLPLPPPPPPPSSRHEPEPAKAQAAAAAAKSKASVFSRISFPGGGGDGANPSDAKRSRRASSDKPPAHSSSSSRKGAAAAEGGDGRHHRGGHQRHQNHREPAAAAEEEKRRPAAAATEYYAGGEDEEESEEEEQHFKRRPSSSSRREREAQEEQPRHSRRSRDHKRR